MLEGLTVRAATERDLLGLLSITPDERLHRERLCAQEAGRIAYLVAGDGRHPVLGFATLTWGGDAHHVDRPVLGDLRVREGYRSQGIGTRLIEQAEHLCLRRGLTRVGLSVNPTGNPRAKSLYERLGYRETGEPPYCDGVYPYVDEEGRQRFEEDWCVPMVKDLENPPC